MGTVHLGRLRGAEGFSRIVVIKCLHDDVATNPEHVAMFLDEARLASRVRHANVVPTLDVAREGDQLWLILEYIAGEALSSLSHRGKLPPDIAVAIFADVLTGLDAVHNAKDTDGTPLDLVHRDVSPQNVLLGVDGVARIADFGIAKARNRRAVTREGEFKGKLAYAAPEVVSGDPATVRADVYGVGMTLWEVLAGRRPFTADTEATLLFQVLETKPPRLSEVAPEVGTAFDALLERALEKDPRRRFATAGEMLDELARCGPCPAPTRAVASWLTSMAGDALCARASLVRRFEAGGPTTGAVTDTTETMSTVTSIDPALRAGVQTESALYAPIRVSSRPSTSAIRRATLLALIAGVLMSGAVVAVLLLLAPTKRPGVTATEPTPVATEPTPPAVTLPLPPVEISPAPSIGHGDPALVEMNGTTSTADASVAPPPKRSGRSGRGRPAAPPPRACDPPFTVDAYGDKQFKPECFH